MIINSISNQYSAHYFAVPLSMNTSPMVSLGKRNSFSTKYMATAQWYWIEITLK